MRLVRRRRAPRPTPVVVISYNRGAMLREVVTSYLALSTRIELVVHDNGSDDADTLAYLTELSGSGVPVTWGPKVRGPDDLNSVNETVRKFFGGLPKSRYVVTDCDVDMSIAAADALTVYGELLDQFPDAECVGPMLRVRDIPQSYPLFNWAMNRHIDQFWRHTPKWTETSVGCIAFLSAPIDTTFALHREGEDFRRLKHGIRVYYPYEARHLDWYSTAAEPSARNYSRTSSSEISHWDNVEQYEMNKNEPLRHTSLLYVDRDERRLTTRRLVLGGDG